MAKKVLKFRRVVNVLEEQERELLESVKGKMIVSNKDLVKLLAVVISLLTEEVE